MGLSPSDLSPQLGSIAGPHRENIPQTHNLPTPGKNPAGANAYDWNYLLMPIPGAARGAVESEARRGMGSDDDEGVSGADLLDGVRSRHHDHRHPCRDGCRDLRAVGPQLCLVPCCRTGELNLPELLCI